MLCVGMHRVTLCVTGDAERPGRHSHAERGNEQKTDGWGIQPNTDMAQSLCNILQRSWATFLPSLRIVLPWLLPP
ncbi:hypothetical protein EMIT0232MI5_210065 [Pseudomonas sp. IT-232MI5]